MIGAEITPDDAPPVVLWTTDRASYGRLSRLITVGRRRAAKENSRSRSPTWPPIAEGLLAGVVSPTRRTGRSRCARAAIASCFGDRCYLLAELFWGRRRRRLDRLAGWPASRVAAGGRRRRPLSRRPAPAWQDVLDGHPVGQKGRRGGAGCFPTPSVICKSPADMAARFARVPEALARTLEIARRSTFSLDELRYEYPEELAPPGETPLEYLRRLTWERSGAALSGRHSRAKVRAGRARAGVDRRVALRGLFSHRVRPGSFRPRAGHPLPGTRFGGQFGRLLLPGSHVGRSRATRTCSSSGSSVASATRRPTSTSISSTSAVRRCCNTSTKNMAAIGQA